MKNKFYFLLINIFGVLLFSNFVFAAPNIGTTNAGLAQKIGQKVGYNIAVDQYTLSQTIGGYIKAALGFVGTIFFALAVYAGFLWMTAQGNEEQVAKATGIIKTAIIGMIIVTAAYSITAFAIGFSSRSNTVVGS